MFCGGRQVFQVGQAPSGPTVIRPLGRNGGKTRGIPLERSQETKAGWTKLGSSSCCYGVSALMTKETNWTLYDVFHPPPLRLESCKPLWRDLQTTDATSRWREDWQSATVINSTLVVDPTIRLHGFDLYRRQWSLLNRFRTGQGHCNACHKKWRASRTRYIHNQTFAPRMTSTTVLFTRLQSSQIIRHLSAPS